MNFFFIEKTKLLWNGIVAPGVEWIAPQHAPACHEGSFEGAILINGLIPIMRTGWIEPAGIFRQATREGGLIEPD
jgi:hypothetical protein